jgi:hypothetical protein
VRRPNSLGAEVRLLLTDVDSVKRANTMRRQPQRVGGHLDVAQTLAKPRPGGEPQRLERRLARHIELAERSRELAHELLLLRA